MKTEQFIEMIAERKIKEAEIKLTAMSLPMTREEKIAAIKHGDEGVDYILQDVGHISHSLNHVIFPQEREGFLNPRDLQQAMIKLEEAKAAALSGDGDATKRIMEFEALEVV